MTSVVQNKLLLNSVFILLSYQLYLSDITPLGWNCSCRL